MSQRVIMPVSYTPHPWSSNGQESSRARPSVEALLLRAADVLESHLAESRRDSPAAWSAETINGLKALTLLTGIWVDVEIDELLAASKLHDGSGGTTLHRTTRSAGRRLQALAGQAELLVGGLRPDEHPEELTAELADELRLIAWRIVAAIAVQHAFLCLLRRRNALVILSRTLPVDGVNDLR